MAREFLKNAVNALAKTKKRKAWLGAAGALACLVLVCTLVATLLPA